MRTEQLTAEGEEVRLRRGELVSRRRMAEEFACVGGMPCQIDGNYVALPHEVVNDEALRVERHCGRTHQRAETVAALCSRNRGVVLEVDCDVVAQAVDVILGEPLLIGVDARLDTRPGRTTVLDGVDRRPPHNFHPHRATPRSERLVR